MTPRYSASMLLTILLIAVTCCCTQAAEKEKDWRNDQNATQLDMNEGAHTDFNKADSKLNKLYQQAKAKHKGETLLLQKLQKAQLAWIAFRDAHMEARYPETDKQGTYGSAYTMCYWTEMAELTEARNKQLEHWVSGTEEGDVCTGSFGVKK